MSKGINVKTMTDDELIAQVDSYYADLAMEDRVISITEEQIEIATENELVRRGFEVEITELVNGYDEVVGYETNIYMEMG